MTIYLFYFFSFLIVCSSFLVVFSNNPVHSVLFLIFTFFNSAIIFLLMNAEFLAMTLVIVYVGAIAVLFLFVVMMLNVSKQKNEWLGGEKNSNHIPIGLLISGVIFFELIIVVGGWKYKPELLKTFSSIGIDLDSTNTHEIGKVLYTDYIHLFQLSGMVLLVAMIGAIVLTFRKREGIKRQSYFKQISRERTEGVELADPKNNEGVKIDV
mgnify:CR=1 FL=1